MLPCFLVGCGDGIDLPGVNVETDLNKIPLPDNNVNLEQVELKPSTEPMLHEGLHTEEDFQRIRDKKAAGEEPWVSAYQLLVESQFSQKTADTYPTEWIKRGVSGDENYMNAARGGHYCISAGRFVGRLNKMMNMQQKRWRI